MKGYQPINNSVKKEKDVLLADPHSILTRWEEHLSPLLNVHGYSDVRQTEIQLSHKCLSPVLLTLRWQFKS
jgi:hypothetical protein